MVVIMMTYAMAETISRYMIINHNFLDEQPFSFLMTSIVSSSSRPEKCANHTTFAQISHITNVIRAVLEIHSST